jgi:hypothetical protein
MDELFIRDWLGDRLATDELLRFKVVGPATSDFINSASNELYQNQKLI